MARKTVRVADLVTKVNQYLAVEQPYLESADGMALAAAQAWRRSVASLLESVLHETGNYRGFGYQAGVLDHSGGSPEMTGDETRRIYYYQGN